MDTELGHCVLAQGAAQETFLHCARAVAPRPSLAKRPHVSVCTPLPPFPPLGGCPRTFPNTGTTSTSPGHHHPARQPRLWRDTKPQLAPPHPCSRRSSECTSQTPGP